MAPAEEKEVSKAGFLQIVSLPNILKNTSKINQKSGNIWRAQQS